MTVKQVHHPADLADAKALSNTKLVVINFTATWCGPCRFMDPIYDSMSDKYQDVEFFKCDVDESSDVAQMCAIRQMPTFQCFKNGKMVEESLGANEQKLQDMIEKHR